MNMYARIAAAVTSVVLSLQVVNAATESRHSPTLSGNSLDARLLTQVVEPLRDRRLGWEMYSRAGPRWDSAALRATAADPRPAADGWIAFRVEAPSLRRPGTFEHVWTGRIHEPSGRVELAHPVTSGQPTWRPIAQVLKEETFKLPR